MADVCFCRIESIKGYLEYLKEGSSVYLRQTLSRTTCQVEKPLVVRPAPVATSVLLYLTHMFLSPGLSA